MKTGEAEHWVQQQLRDLYSEAERNIMAAWVLEKITGLPRVARLRNRTELLQAEQLHALTALVQRLKTHEPIQYVLGEAHFYGLKLYVDRHVLIPRPETEELVDWIFNDLKASGKKVFDNTHGKADKTRSLKILDVGTGSGCIALALKKTVPKAEVWGCDSSDEALNVARRNGAALDIRVDFQQIDILDQARWNNLPNCDIIVSNPPYIPLSEHATLHSNVVQHEPHTALFVPNENPLLFYEMLACFGIEKLHVDSAIYVEIHEERGSEVVQLFQKHKYQDVELRNDMQGKARMVKAIVPR